MSGSSGEVRAGIDIGSVTTKCVLVRSRQLISAALTRTTVSPEEAARTVLEQALSKAGLDSSCLSRIVSTGYGRRRCQCAREVVTEITAAATGAFHLNNNRPAVVIDVGGQDTKVIQVAEDGSVTDFLMNDKCAAGTGRFLEMMAVCLETDLEGLSRLAARAVRPASINSTCSVFAESEVVSLIARGVVREEIAAGLFQAIAGRIATMVNQFPPLPETLFCGGGATSPGLHQALEKSVGRPIKVLPWPQYVVAFGAVLSV
ncbi:MAG TPA: acyl-CoA dehydratase activase [bacterium]|nr:acyl-CoA dehydratase activase [bacterium]HOL66311.1 acyl-CoA dehydratase activase [bacterium]